MENFNYTEVLELEIRFVTIEQVKRFVIGTEKCQGKIAIYSHDNYVADGRSLMGIFALDLSKPVTVVCDESNYKDVYVICEELNIIVD